MLFLMFFEEKTKKYQKKFGGNKKYAYLCNRKQETMVP